MKEFRFEFQKACKLSKSDILNLNQSAVMFQLERELIERKFDNKRKTLKEYLNDLELKFTYFNKKTVEFELKNVDCSVVNAIRRVLLSETPSIAIESVIFKKYDGIMPEENLAHRLGLIPIEIDSSIFEFSEGTIDEKNGLKFSLRIKNTTNSVLTVFSNEIKWIPIGNQAATMQPPKIKQNIPITKLGKNHEVDIEMVAIKGIGAEHAKWSPVSLATYRMYPIIEIRDVFDSDAYKLQRCFSPGVIDILECSETGRKKAVVANAKLDTASREALRHPEFKDKVFLGKSEDHFIFTIESIYMDPIQLLRQALSILKAKSMSLADELNIK